MARNNMSIFPLNTFDLPQNTAIPMEPEYMPDNPAPTMMLETVNPMGNMNTSPAAPPLSAAEPLSAQPPDMAIDPTLESIMREAQGGLFVIYGNGGS